MRIFGPRETVEHFVEGVQGALRTLNVVDSEDLICGLRSLEPHSKAPKLNEAPSAHHHLVYAIRGTGTVSNGEYYEKVNPGSFALFEHGERPYYQTGDAELVVLEVAWKPATRRIAPVPVPSAAPAALRSAAATPAVYDEI